MRARVGGEHKCDHMFPMTPVCGCLIGLVRGRESEGGSEATDLIGHWHLLVVRYYVGVHSAPQASGVGVTWFMETTLVGATSRSWFDAVLCGISSCVVPSPMWSVDVSVVDARARRMRPIPY